LRLMKNLNFSCYGNPATGEAMILRPREVVMFRCSKN